MYCYSYIDIGFVIKCRRPMENIDIYLLPIKYNQIDITYRYTIYLTYTNSRFNKFNFFNFII